MEGNPEESSVKVFSEADNERNASCGVRELTVKDTFNEFLAGLQQNINPEMF